MRRGWLLPDISGMSQPVKCRCGNIYDLGKVTIVQRYLDCSVWQTPCCKQLADDRPAGWSSVQWYTRLDRVDDELGW